MASRSDSAGSARPRSRRSIAHVPRSRFTSGVDKENTTTDISSSQPILGSTRLGGKDKKSRSKSLGPGGLDALQNSNGNRRKSTTAFPLKSILKPTVPVSPVRNIPSFEETRKRTPARGSQSHEDNQSGGSQGKEGMLIDLGTPAQPPGSIDESNPFDSFNASSIRDEMAAARERDEKARRERERKAILEQREARRKSMANRRVSFAPEATLHTWNVVEIPDDSTSSSTSNSTRRASSLTTENQATPAAAQTEAPSSPDAEIESDIAFSPVQYPDLQQLANRPQYGAYDGMGGSQQMSSSPFSGSSADGSEDIGLQAETRDEDEEDDDNSSTSGFDGESTAMSLDDVTAHSAATARSEESNTSSSARLNEALRQAAREAGTKSIDDDENGEMSMEIADQEITGAFQPWIKKGQRQSFDWEDISARHDQENAYRTDHPIRDAGIDDAASDNGDEDMSMEVTNAIGRIITKPASRRQSAIRRKSSGEETNYGEQTMELTNVVGGIAQPTSPAGSTGADSNVNEDEEMTMEFTSVVGGLLGKPSTQDGDEDDYGAARSSAQEESNERNFSEWNDDGGIDDGEDMEITGAVGGILPPNEERDESEDDDQTVGMEVTTAMGRILPPEAEASGREEAKEEMEVEFESAERGSSPFQETVRQSPAKSPASFHVATVTSDSGSPSLASVKSRRTRQSLTQGALSNTPTSTTPKTSPSENLLTPPKQSTPQVSRPTTPGETPPSSAKGFRNASPKKLFQPELQGAANKRKSPRKSLFGNNAMGESTPLFVLQPKSKRRSSGLGIDKEGLGSPKVAAMLDKRRSIGEDSAEFVPQEQRQQGVRFEDPLKLQEEVDREREEEESREDGHIPPLQGNDRDATTNLRDMISSLTPRKNKLAGRKSLHVGAARGLLGKRPMELDLPDDDSDHTPKRLRGREASPVKNIKLPAPPTKDETVGRLGRSPAPPAIERSPAKASTTPTREPKGSSVIVTPMEDEPTSSNATSASESAQDALDRQEESGPEVEPIQLQEFLNMTNIHFMELTTTKRRHTTAPDSATRRRARLSSEKSSASKFDDCVAAGFCTVPMLELYQHSCRELKSYISEGRQVIRSIETETYTENPPLFREYMTAPPDIRLLMDNQFRNVKTHARFLSKATWYEWRMKLLEGLKDGLNRHVEEMRGDDELLSKYETLLSGVVPALVEKHSSLEEQATSLQQLTDEIENCDQDELRDAREKLFSIEEEIASKKKLLEELQAEAQEKTNTIETGAELKAEYLGQIQEAERVKEECRGWSAKEISELKESVDKMERQTGWSIISATSPSSPAGPLVTMSYRNQLQLSFHPGAFFINNNNSQPPATDEKMPIELKHSPQGRTQPMTHSALSPIGLLVLKSLQIELATIPQSKTAPKQMLHFVAQAWDLVLNLEEEARMLGFCGATKLKFSEIDAKPALRARCTLLELSSGKGSSKAKDTGARRVDVDFAVKTCVQKGNAGDVGVLAFETDVIASKVYGFGTKNRSGMSEDEMRKLLRKELGGKSGPQLGNGIWSKAVQTLTGTVF
ncbi:hypothetical protein BDV32DRAFT_159211 [Aspergillus pseudonomiae]|uniref:Uncharacterized protein n=1 Tax=Aspergillus pseudonomiae TaxID=1506151 RepID=A0A5N6HYX9_9EURO|nr:uncharacterized protein BDV37DRAFT_287596 [Aspergillus pseudonomiae]KAB8259662.1 hypothetical protein BDV32DRAFT_159211 [Aspergillus pseudonomiae]KAE8399476.1 hypothetical protein BDV37DRAFT_287596 [Aspergillus pseudonomiae]